MQRFSKLASLAAIASILSACGSHSGAIPVQSLPNSGMSSVAQNPGTDRSQWHPYFKVLQPTGLDAIASINAASTIKTFTSSIKSPIDGNTYSYTIVGTNPHTSKTTTNITYVPIVLVLKFPGGVTLDPRKPACGDTVSVSDRFYKGPNFVSVPLKSNGISVGTTQINDGDQRAQWWSVVKGTGYHTMLKASTSTPIVVTKTAPSGSTSVSGACSGTSHNIGEIDINAFDSMVRTIINANATTTQVPLVLSYNVVETEGGGCCVIGYHSAYSRGGATQVYSIGAYTDQVFSAPGIRDIHAWTHEIGELLNDPFINNATPLWGHVGQVSGCQGNLEVGDPLTGTPFTVTLNGFTYHPQELTFFDWFFRTPAEGTGGEFSFEGTFENNAGAVCH